MELDEFRIGDLGAGQRRHGHAFAAQIGGVGGHGEQAARSAGGQYNRRSIDFDCLAAIGDQCTDDGDCIGLDQAERLGAFPHFDAGRLERGGDDRLEDLLAGQVAADAGHAGQGMGGFAIEHERAVGLVIERGTDGV